MQTSPERLALLIAAAGYAPTPCDGPRGPCVGIETDDPPAYALSLVARQASGPAEITALRVCCEIAGEGDGLRTISWPGCPWPRSTPAADEAAILRVL